MRTKFNFSYLFLFLFCIPISVFSQWTQIGSNIEGEASEDLFGNSASINSNGTVVAFGATHNDGNGAGVGAGHVRIYKNVGNNWIQLGSDLDGDELGDNLGWSLDLDSTGNIVAIGIVKYLYNGAVRVFHYNGTNWSQLGNDIVGENLFDNDGYSVSINSDGTIVAVGSTANSDNGEYSGHVRVFQYNGSDWIQMGNDIDGEAIGDKSGGAVSINANGTIVAIGATFNGGNGENSGHVRVFQYNGNSWSQLGNDIDGEAAGDHSGNSVSLCSDGLTLAIGAYQNSENGDLAGQVRIFKYNDSDWIQMGNDIDGEAAGDYVGVSVSLNSDGLIVAIGAHMNSNNGTSAGQTKIYSFNGLDWQQIGSDIYGENSNDMSGRSVALSSFELIVAIGAPQPNSSENNNGIGRVFGYSTAILPQNNQLSQLVYPNPTNGKITIDLDEFESIEIFNSMGQIIARSKSEYIDICNQPTGIYFIRVLTRQETKSQRIIKK